MLNLFAENETTVGNKNGGCYLIRAPSRISFLLISHGSPPRNRVWNKQFTAAACCVAFLRRSRLMHVEPMSYSFTFLDGVLAQSAQT